MTLEISGVSKSFGSTTVLSDVSLTVEQGSRLALVGASGSGKSTLLRLIAGFEQPDVGSVSLDGRALAGVPAHRRGIGYVSQDGALFPHLTVARNIAFGLPRSAQRKSRVLELMELTSLDPALADRKPFELSGGQQQRVALSRALAQRPRVILLDEPFSALDTGLRAHTRQAVIDILELSGVTAVLVTHDQDEALSFGQQVGVLADGRLVQAGEPSAVFDAPVDAEVASFLGETILLSATRAQQGTIDCGLGRLPVAHDLSLDAPRVVAMIRPDQLIITPSSDGSATVASSRSAGASIEVAIRVDNTPRGTLVYRVPRRLASQFSTGSIVRVAVDGGVVLYPEPIEP